MPDFRVADTAPEHPKLRAVGLPAIGLWAAAGAYAMRELTDGWVPEYWVLTWPGAKRHATALVGIGLWERETRRSIPGYRFRDWLDYQRPASKIQEEREKGKERARRSRERAGERSPEVTADVRSASHDSLPLTQQNTPVEHIATSPERANANSGRAAERPIPDGWTPHAGHHRTAAHRRVNIEHESAQFLAHAQAHDRHAVDWDAAFTVWLGSAKTGSPNPWLRTSNGTDANIAALIQAGQDEDDRRDEQRAIGSG